MENNSRFLNIRYLILATAFLGVFLLINRNKYLNEPMREVSISVAQQPAFALIYIADKKGYFESEGLKVTLKKHLLGRDAMQEMINGKSDLATVFDVVALNSIYSGNNISLITSLHKSDTNHVLASFRKNGINNLKDVVGKKIAYTPGTSTEFFIYSLLATNNIDSNSIIAIEIEPNQLIENLENGKVDAAVLFNPISQQFTKSHNAQDVSLIYSDAYHETSLLIAKADYVKSNKDTVSRVLRALYKAEQFAHNNKEQSIEIVDEALDNLSKENVKDTWEVFQLSLGLTNRLLTQMEQQSRFFYRRGVYKSEIPHLRQYFAIDLLKQIKPYGVTMF